MTHGSIWLPLNPADPRSKMFFIDTYSDGYLDGVGLGLWSSSQRIEPLCAISALFGGQAFFADPSTGSIQAQQDDYVINLLDEAMCEFFDGDDDEAEEDPDGPHRDERRLLRGAQAAFEALKSGDEQGALSSEFARLPVERRQELLQAHDFEIVEPEEAWRHFADGAPQLSQTEAARLCADHLLNANGVGLHSSTAYYWRDGQFHTQVYKDGDYKTPMILPLGMAHAALGDGSGVFGNGIAYLANATEIDQADLACLIDELESRGASHELLFKGAAIPLLSSLREKKALDALLGATVSKSSPRRPI